MTDARPPAMLVPRFGDPIHAGMDRETTAWWALDISAARPLVAGLAGDARPSDWMATLLAAIRIADVDQNTVHLLGPFAGRLRMIGQPVTSYWPLESWPALAEVVVALAKAPPGTSLTRQVTSIAFDAAVINFSTDASGALPDILFVSVGGIVASDRSLWSVRASEERYRNLIHHLPWALLQVDSTPMTLIFDALRAEGVTDIAAHLDATPDLAIHSRNVVRVTDANRKAVQLLGAEHVDRLIGSVDYLFMASPDTAKRVIKAHFDGERRYSELIRMGTFDGRIRDVELNVTYPTPPERLDVTLLCLDDVTDRLRTEAQFRQLQADFSRAARISTLGELATSIAHEVNQPLSAIVTNAETSLRWLSRPEPNLAKVTQLTTRIADSARHASDIVKRIRGMAAPRAPERERLDLNVVVFEGMVFVRHEIESRAIDLSMRLGSNLPAILGDRVQLLQVIVNLLLNAVQAVEAKGRIDLSTALDDHGCVNFTVHDSGPGISPENLDRVFSSFFTTKEEGVGIGLAICQSIIAAHGGTIGATNHPEGGAQFRISLPVASV